MDIQVIIALCSGIILFLYGIEQFSAEIQAAGGKRFRATIQRYTRTPLHGTILGTIITAIVQSSTATTVITVGLVNAGTLSFAASLGVIFGANIGTTVTAQLVAFNLIEFAPVFIIAGFLISIAGGKWRFIGKPLFYFGLVFFSLNLVSSIMAPYQDDPFITGVIGSLDNVILEVLAGFIVTTVFQSSSVTVGLIVIMAMNGIITPAEGIPIALGANLGTPTTALLVASRMNTAAKQTAAAQFLFNLIGVLIFIPLMTPFSTLITSLGGGAAQQIANAHFIFNLTCAILFLITIRQFTRLVTWIVPSDRTEIVFTPAHLTRPLPAERDQALLRITRETGHLITQTSLMIHPLLEKQEQNPEECRKIHQLGRYAHYLSREIQAAILEVSKTGVTPDEAYRIAVLARSVDLIRQLSDQVLTLGKRLIIAREKDRLTPPAYQGYLTLLIPTVENLDTLVASYPRLDDPDDQKMRENDSTLRNELNLQYGLHLKRMGDPSLNIGSLMLEILSSVEQIAAIIRELRKNARLVPDWEGTGTNTTGDDPEHTNPE